MRRTPPSWSRERRLEACIQAPVGSHLLREDSRVVERPGWYQVITPSCPSGSLNEVVFSAVDEGELDESIDRTAAEYARAGVPCKWCVGPWSRPAGLGEALARRGFRSWPVRGMAVDPRSLEPDVAPGLEVVSVGRDDLDSYVSVYAAGWELAEAEREPFRRSLEAALERDRDRSELFVGLRDGEPVAVGSHRLRSDGSAYLGGAVVLEGHRGRGLYRALLAARLARLRELGVELATTQARDETSAPILERLGFETLFRSRCYERPPP